MNNSSPSAPSRLDQVIAEYLEAVEAGRVPNRRELMKANPGIARELSVFFEDQDRFDVLTAPLRHAAAMAPTLTPNPGAASGATIPPQKIGYFGDYELVDEIARGGMGVVYKARQASLNRTVALKMILSGQLASAQDMQRFRAEAEAAASLDHPNIVPIYEIGEHEGKQYFSMKLVEGGSLSKSIGNLPRDPRAAAKLLATVAHAVHFAHQCGILHRDLKPANILLDKAGVPHVTDFGLAKRVEGDSELTQSGAVMGTPAYMAPEQASGNAKRLTTAADVYSLGTILYEALTGFPPFKAETVLGVLLKVKQEDPQPPRQLNPKIDRDLETICLKCLEKEPQKRYGSAEALAEDLECWLRHEPIMARPVGLNGRMVRWCRRHPGLSIASGLAAAVIVTLVGYFQWRLIDENARTRHALDQAQIARHSESQARQTAEKNAAQARAAEEQARAAEQQALQSRGAAEYEAYLAQIRLAHDKIQNNEVGEALAALQSCPESLRGWEWKRVKYLCNLVLPISEELGYGQTIAISSDGKLAAHREHPENIIKVWDVEQRREIGRFKPHKHGSSSRMEFSGDSKMLACDSSDGILRCWNIESGKETQLNTGIPYGYADSLALSSDGRHLAYSCHGTRPSLWDVVNARKIADLACYFSDVAALDFSKDGRRLAAVLSDQTLILWDVATGKALMQLSGHKKAPTCLCFSPSGKLVVSGDDDKTCIVWNTETGAEVARFHSHSEPVIQVSFLDETNIMSCGRDQKICVWNLNSKAVIRSTTLKGNVQYYPTGFAVARDGSRAIATLGGQQWSVLVCDALLDRTARQVRNVALRNSRWMDHWHVADVVSPDARYVLTRPQPGELHALCIHDSETGKQSPVLQGHAGKVLNAEFSPDGTLIVSGGEDKSARVWETATGRQVHAFGGLSGPVDAVFGAEGKSILAFTDKGSVRRFSLETMAEVAKYEMGGGSPKFSPARDRILIKRGKKPAVLDAASGAELAAMPGEDWGMFVGNTQVLSITGDCRRARLWDLSLRTGPKAEFKFDELNMINGFSIRTMNASVNGQAFALADNQNGLVLNNALREVLKFKSGGVDFAFSPDGARLIMARQSETELRLALWDSERGREIFAWSGRFEYRLRQIAFSKDGRKLLLWMLDDSLRILPSSDSLIEDNKLPAGAGKTDF